MTLRNSGPQRMTGAAKPAAAAAACLAILAAAAARAAPTPCWIDHGAVVVSAAFGDIAGDFILDLSRPASALHVTQANLDGIDSGAATAPFTLAGRRIAALTLPVLDLDQQTGVFDTAVAGVVGWDVLRRYAVTLDLRHGACSLTLSPEGRRPARGLPLTLVGGAPAVEALIADSRSSRRDLFWIDTSRAPSRIAGATLARPAPKDGASARLRAVSVAGRLFEQVPAELPSAEPGSAIGMAVWRGARLRIDPQAGVVTIAWPRRRP